MPYEWLPPAGDEIRLHLWPYRSLPKRGFVGFIGVTAAFLALPLLAFLGSPILWALLPFVAGALGALYWAIARSYRQGDVLEVLVLGPDRALLTRHNPGQPARAWQANPHWIRVELRATGGPVPNYLTLHGGPRVVELGRFLAEDERRSLWVELREKLAAMRRFGP